MTDHDSREMAENGFEEGEEKPPPGVRTMAIVRWVLIVLMGLVALGSFLDYFGVFERAAAAKDGTIYYCPMHPQIQQDHPGECPICSMTLVPKKGAKASAAQDDHEHAVSQPASQPASRPASQPASRPSMADVPGLAPVELTADRIQLIGMRTAKLERAELAESIRTVGFITADEEGLARIHTRFAGWIEALNVSKTGQKVNRGQVLAAIYSPELFAAQSEFLNAKKWARTDTIDLAADARRRLELLGISSEEIDEIERTGKPKRALAIRSPVSGYVTTKNALLGMYVQPGTELFEVADLSTVWVLADVYEYEVARVAVGQKARLSLAAFPGKTFSGRVDFIYPTLDPESRTLRLRIVFPNREGTLKPSMYGEVSIELAEQSGLVVPREAIVDTGELQYVFLALDGGRFEPRRVRVGARAGEKVEVLEGLVEGDVVVTTANFLLDSESRLQAAISLAPATEGGGQGPDCARDFDATRYPDKTRACRACEIQHRGMGTMEEDCKNAIPKPWR
jgi:membrane fusion protein, copper/silver efflux system